jgi:hypothetical protein
LRVNDDAVATIGDEDRRCVVDLHERRDYDCKAAFGATDDRLRVISDFTGIGRSPIFGGRSPKPHFDVGSQPYMSNRD